MYKNGNDAKLNDFILYMYAIYNIHFLFKAYKKYINNITPQQTIQNLYRKI